MIGGFAKVAHRGFGAVRGKMSKLFAVVTHNIMTGIGVVAGLITVATGTGLSFVTQVQLYFSKAQKIRDGILDAHTIMPDTVLDMFEARFTKIAMAVMKNVTVFGQTIDDGRIG